MFKDAATIIEAEQKSQIMNKYIHAERKYKKILDLTEEKLEDIEKLMENLNLREKPIQTENKKEDGYIEFKILNSTILVIAEAYLSEGKITVYKKVRTLSNPIKEFEYKELGKFEMDMLGNMSEEGSDYPMDRTQFAYSFLEMIYKSHE